MPPCLVLAVLALGVAEAPPVVIDNERFFGKAAVERVQSIAARLLTDHGVHLCIETMQEAPGVSAEKLRTLSTRKVLEELKRAALERADGLGVHGIYVMITTNPNHVLVIANPPALEKEEDTSDFKREEMRRTLARLRLDRDPDTTLVRAIEQYSARVREPARPSPLQTWPALVVVGGLLGFWLLLRIIRARSGNGLPIYQPAMLGSIFGVPAGFWIHDCLFQAERPVGPPASEAELPTLAAPAVMPPVPEEVSAAPVVEAPHE